MPDWLMWWVVGPITLLLALVPSYIAILEIRDWHAKRKATHRA